MRLFSRLNAGRSFREEDNFRLERERGWNRNYNFALGFFVT